MFDLSVILTGILMGVFLVAFINGIVIMIRGPNRVRWFIGAALIVLAVAGCVVVSYPTQRVERTTSIQKEE